MNILDTEYSTYFDKLRQNRMEVSYFKYGPITENAGNKLVKIIESLELRLEKYKQTGNTEFLADIANFAMIEYVYPQHSKAHFDDLSESPGVVGMTYRELASY